MVKFSFVQGRLSAPIANKYQHFPTDSWREEFKIGKSIGFQGMEWIISDFSNPLFDTKSQLEIISLCKENNISISSISLDLLMQQTLNRFSLSEITWMLKKINKISKKVGLKRVSIPIEESCGIRDPQTFREVQKSIIRLIETNVINASYLAVETDMSPQALKNFLKQPKMKDLGILLDVGNAAAYGYSLENYFNELSEKIISIHIKDRRQGFGISVPLGKGDAEFNYLFKNINKLKNLRDITFQTYKSSDNFVEDLKDAKKYISNFIDIGN